MSGFKDFIKAIRKENLESVKRLFKKDYFKQKSSKGRTALHVASGCNNKGDIVKFLVIEGFNIEEEACNDSRERCIHISARWGRLEVLKTLIEAGCDIESLNKEGETAWSLALREGRDECMEILKSAKKEKEVWDFLSLLKENCLSMIMDPQTGETLLDKLLSNKDQRIMEAIKSKKVNDKEIDEWRDLDLRTVNSQSHRLLHECMLARCLYQGYENGVFDLYSADLVNKDSLFIEPTFLETAVDCDVSAFCLTIILLKVFKVDESWQRAEEIAKTKQNLRNKQIISKRREYLISKEKEGYGRLEIAVWENDSDMIEYIMNNQSVKDDKGQKESGAALSMSYYIGHMECTESLQKNKVNVNTVDKLKQSSLHMAIYKRRQEYCDYLVDNLINTEETDFMNFTVLERSVMNDCKDICEKLVKNGARCDKYVEIETKCLKVDRDLSTILYNIPHLPITESESIHTLCFKLNKTVYPGLLCTIDHRTMDLTDADGNTLLHLCAISLNMHICSQLILKDANVNLNNKNQRTPLLELLIQNFDKDTKQIKKNMIETVQILIEGGAALNVEDLEQCTILSIATKYDNEELLSLLTQKIESIEYIQRSDFLAWFRNKNYKLVKEMIPLINKSLLSQWITNEIIENCLRDDDLITAKSLYDEVSFDIRRNVLEAILYKAAINNEVKLFTEIIDCEISPESSLEEEESLMSFLIREKKKEFIRVVIRSRHKLFFLERFNKAGKLPLHICIECEYWDVIDRLITDTKSINNEDNEGNTPLSLLLTKMSETDDDLLCDRLITYVKTLILKSADIYKVNKHNKTVITHCTKCDIISEIESFIIEHKPCPRSPIRLTTTSCITADEECGYSKNLSSSSLMTYKNTDSRPTPSRINDTNLFSLNVRPYDNINTTESLNTCASSIESDDNPLGLMSVPQDD